MKPRAQIHMDRGFAARLLNRRIEAPLLSGRCSFIGRQQSDTLKTLPHFVGHGSIGCHEDVNTLFQAFIPGAAGLPARYSSAGR